MELVCLLSSYAVSTLAARVVTNPSSTLVMGDIPAETNMISTIITYPFQNQLFTVNTPFFVRFRTANLAAGSVTNPNSTLYSAPQTLNDGKVIGHVHVTIQQLFGFSEGMVEGQEAHIAPPDPTKVTFFKTIFGKGDGEGGFSVQVRRGLPVGYYRVCTMVAASNHQPVIMPVSEMLRVRVREGWC
jgi:hypothetical protein